jgi:hypothetical protein
VFSAWYDVIAPILGLLITAFAATLGAPLWFDVLNRITVLRATIKPSDTPSDQAADARQRARTSGPGSGWAAVSIAAAAPAEPSAPRPLAPPAAIAEMIVEPTGEELDGCDGPIHDGVPDEELPPARGGVA